MRRYSSLLVSMLASRHNKKGVNVFYRTAPTTTFSGRSAIILILIETNSPGFDGIRSQAMRDWQKLLIDHGYHSRTIAKSTVVLVPSLISKSRIIAEEFEKLEYIEASMVR